MIVVKYRQQVNIALVILGILFLGAACSFKTAPPVPGDNRLTEPAEVETDNTTAAIETAVTFPLDEYVANRTLKVFGQYISDRFTGYHNAEDVEVIRKNNQSAVQAVADGTIVYKKNTSGYGGLVVIRHPLPDGTVQGIYGHISLTSVKKNVGDIVSKGEIVGYLGADKSSDTDGERQHLHFGLYRGTDINVSGYVSRPEQLVNWLNPTDWFNSHGLIAQTVGEQTYTPGLVAGDQDFHLSFKYPAGWRIEYVPQLSALNLFTLSGAGPARERSQIFIRWFDATDFLTLETVDVLEKQAGITAGRPSVAYLIKKKIEAPDFPYQPGWRNTEHRVIDIKSGAGNTRFYVVAQNPELSAEQFEQFLNSITFSNPDNQ